MTNLPSNTKKYSSKKYVSKKTPVVYLGQETLKSKQGNEAHIYMAPHKNLLVEQYTPVHFGFYSMWPTIEVGEEEKFDTNLNKIIINSYPHKGSITLIEASPNSFTTLMCSAYDKIRMHTIEGLVNSYELIETDEEFLLVWKADHICKNNFLILSGSFPNEAYFETMKAVLSTTEVKIKASALSENILLPQGLEINEFNDIWSPEFGDMEQLFAAITSLQQNNYSKVIEKQKLNKLIPRKNITKEISKI